MSPAPPSAPPPPPAPARPAPGPGVRGGRPPVPTAVAGGPAPAGPRDPGAVGPGRPGHHGLSGLLSRLVETTPRQLRAWSACAVLACAAFGVLGAVALHARSDALADARADAEQFVRLQAMRTNIVQADAEATNAFLVGGLEPVEQRQAYDDRLAAVARDVAVAAGAAPVDAETLGRVNDALTRYTGLVESARANNRQGFPIATAYLRQASTVLRTEILPTLTTLSTVTGNRVIDHYDWSDRALHLLVLVLALTALALLGGQWWLAQRTHRILNPAVVVATALVAVGAVVGLTVMRSAQADAEDVRTGAYAATVAMAQARVAAFDAKSYESLSLIYRGSGPLYETPQKQASQAAVDALAKARGVEGASVDAVADALRKWGDAHAAIRALDDAGQWDEAVKQATALNGPSNTEFNHFDQASRQRLDGDVATTRDGLAAAQDTPRLFVWLVLAAGLAAAVAAWRGYDRRLEEYR
jgi:hypothetical protein